MFSIDMPMTQLGDLAMSRMQVNISSCDGLQISIKSSIGYPSKSNGKRTAKIIWQTFWENQIIEFTSGRIICNSGPSLAVCKTRIIDMTI